MCVNLSVMYVCILCYIGCSNPLTVSAWGSLGMVLMGDPTLIPTTVHDTAELNEGGSDSDFQLTDAIREGDN